LQKLSHECIRCCVIGYFDDPMRIGIPSDHREPRDNVHITDAARANRAGSAVGTTTRPSAPANAFLESVLIAKHLRRAQHAVPLRRQKRTHNGDVTLEADPSNCVSRPPKTGKSKNARDSARDDNEKLSGRCEPSQTRVTHSLLIREYNGSDLDALRRMHARQGFDYAFPDLADPIFVSKLVVEDDEGQPVMASLARLTCEMYLLADPSAATPRERYARLLALHSAGERDLLARGLDDAHAWLPPPIAKRFGRRLGALGWVRDCAWTPYCRRLKAVAGQ
jgi:hypothetical protein